MSSEPTAPRSMVQSYLPFVHTPGPWRVDETVALGAYGVWADYPTNPSGQSQVCSVFVGNKSDFPREMRDANARLIAEAPAMRKALEDVRAALNRRARNDLESEVMRIANLALLPLEQAESKQVV